MNEMMQAKGVHKTNVVLSTWTRHKAAEVSRKEVKSFKGCKLEMASVKAARLLFQMPHYGAHHSALRIGDGLDKAQLLRLSHVCFLALSSCICFILGRATAVQELEPGSIRGHLQHHLRIQAVQCTFHSSVLRTWKTVLSLGFCSFSFGLFAEL